MEINERRQSLLPKIREERKDNRAVLKYEKLYINGVPWNPPPNLRPNSPRLNRHAWDRPTRGVNHGIERQNFSKIKFSCINVCGIRSKLLLPEFIDLIKSNDICIFLETETDIYDIFNLPTGYTSSCTSKCRSKFCKKSGGIIFIYKTELEIFFKFPKNDSEYVLWVKYSKMLYKEEFLLDCKFIPPENSQYSSINSYTDENE